MSIRSQIQVLTFTLLIVALDSFVHAQIPGETATSLIVVISGFGSDASSEQLASESPRGRGNSGMYQLVGDLRKAGFETQFFNWNGTIAGQSAQEDAPGADGIVAFIRKQHSTKHLKHLVVIGHSWGGHTMIEVAQKLKDDLRIDISLAIGVDPSSFSRGERIKELPLTIQSFVNFHTRNLFVWGAWPDDERIHNVDLGDPMNGFAANSRRNYAATFDVNAHNAAEWDELIHADIVKRIRDLFHNPETDTPPAIEE